MQRTAFTLACVLGLAAVAGAQQSTSPSQPATAEDVAKLKQAVKELEQRVQETERKSALDRLNFTGDFRFEAHSIDATVPTHFDGMALQGLMVNTFFYYGGTGHFPASLDDVNQFIAQHYAEYLYFTQHLTYDQLGQAIGTIPQEMLGQLYQFLLPHTYVPGYDANNDILYTSRLRLRMHADVADDVTFDGRLSMYKAWGDSTGVQVFNGQPSSINIDGTTAGVPNSDILRVERAYFTWKDIASLVLARHDGRFDYFGSFNYMKSHPRNVTTPFGGLFSDPFTTPESHDGTMYYLGARYNFPNGKTKLGLELNHGSEYWFNFTAAEDDVIAPKTAARGDVWELYLTHRIAKSFLVKLDVIDYAYDYSGSGWHLGAPKPLDESPIIGFPTYDKVTKYMLSMTARFQGISHAAPSTQS